MIFIISAEKKEKRTLLISFFAGLFFAVTELIYSILSHSQSVLTDAVYDASELIFIALILFLTPLFYKPVTEKHPYGYFQVESIFLIVKGFMMLSVSLSISMDIIKSAITGGNPVDSIGISFFQLMLGAVSCIIYLIIHKMNRKVASPTVKAELIGWKMDIFYSGGMALAFFGSAFLERTPLKFIAPYFDQIIAVLIMVFMLPESIKILINAIKDVFLFSPDSETSDKIKDICNNTLENTEYNPVFFDITRTGRHLWVSVYFKSDGDIINIKDVKTATEKLNKEIAKSFQNCTCELILAP